MNTQFKYALVIAIITVASSHIAQAVDSQIPWADNSGGTESTHIAAVGQDLNSQHQTMTKTQEGVWAANSGSISQDEQALQSNKPAFAGTPSLMPHQG
ncbi:MULTISPECIES: hypothetical protein [Yersinia]|uniref:hypothetical protein n=1 Tax=Yersinia TaxID=629 RepID=UPI0005E62615|nr:MULTISPECIES: hypothetical protein [Yersinia]OVZ97589.1 hypothetical protein CBW53_09335 [Yersinia frederiksenii]RXA94762.1 hypothetical protein EQP49_16970 [Yersinia sp. 2105 StPb PI]CNI04135.1 Uncharacterised protein [Yersinia frederiksenii]CNI85290.1 Uncharacterised protein [Yersinia frederiksenii]